jgi:hypothetical protein
LRAVVRDVGVARAGGWTAPLNAIYGEGEIDGATHKDFLSVRRVGMREVQRDLRRYNNPVVLPVGPAANGVGCVGWEREIDERVAAGLCGL